jgi:hypothetical protein
MDNLTELLNDLKSLFEEESIKEIIKTLKEENIVGTTIISENVWRFSLAGTNYILFNNQEQADRIAIQVIQHRLEDKDQSFDEKVVEQNFKVTNPSYFAKKEAKKKYQYMSVSELARDYRSGLRNKDVSEQKEYEARELAISRYADEVLNEICSNPVRFFREKEGLSSVFSILEKYSNYCYLDYLSAASDLVSKFGFGFFLQVISEPLLFTCERRALVREAS